MRIAILLIAAGSSSRLGQPKQLLPYREKTLLGNSIQVCLDSQLGEVHLILGANQAAILEKVETEGCQIHINPNWQEGMSTSIAFGVRQILDKNYDGLIISVADQPFLEKEHLIQLIENYKQQQKSIILSQYEEGKGPPTFFEKKHLEELAILAGDDGAKAVIKKHLSQVSFVSFLRGNIDVDEKADIKWLFD